MIRHETPIEVAERTDPLLELAITTVDAETKARSPYNFTGVGEVEFQIKEGVATPDIDADTTYTLTSGSISIIGDPTAGRIRVQILSPDLPSGNGVRRYRVDAITGGKRTLLAAGPFIIKNI